MKIRVLGLLGLACSLAFASTAGLAEDKPVVSNKWRIEVDETAKSDGTITFRLTPQEGAPIDVPVALASGRSENQVADAISDAFNATVDKETYKVEVDDGEDVLVKKRKGKQLDPVR